MDVDTVTLRSLHIHPIKSCAGLPVPQARVVETGLEFDRAWMVVDATGQFLTQRDEPRLQLVRPTLRASDLVLRAPGMLALHLALDAVERRCRVRVWDDTLDAYDMGDLAAQWFSDFLRAPVRLARFDPDERRLSDHAWTGDHDAENAFSDGFPLLVASGASLDELNRRLAAHGKPAVTMERFRPNLVLDGLDAHGEDFLDEVAFDTPQGPVRLRLVKPCARCTIPNVDPQTAERGSEPGDTLAGYRADARVGGGVTFGMNAVIVEGVGRTLRAGLMGRTTIRF
jgi:uncharacterized protein YcbX